MDEKLLRQIIKRLEAVERAISDEGRRNISSQRAGPFSGPSGGVRLLISRGFFRAKRSLGDVRKALEKNDYHYGAPQVQTALNRLSSRSGPLAASTEEGRRLYVRRK